MIQEGRKFDAAFGAAAGSPGEQRQTEAHYRGTEAIELVFELEFVLRGQWLAAPVHQTQQRLKEEGGALVVGIGKGGADHRLHSPGGRDSGRELSGWRRHLAD